MTEIRIELTEDLDKKVRILMVERDINSKKDMVEQILKEYLGEKENRDTYYGKYISAIKPHVDWFKKQIKESKDGVIIAKTKDIAKEMGGGFPKKNPTSIYWGLKYVLFNEGIVVETGTHQDGNKILLMRFTTEGDKLPDSLNSIRIAEDMEK